MAKGGRVGRLPKAGYGLVLAATIAGASERATAQTTPAGAPNTPAAPATPAQPAPTPPKSVQGLTVTATPPPVRSSIDRRSYDISKDLNATSGTVADMLRSVPALSVDLQGTVSIRGDSNVVIMI